MKKVVGAMLTLVGLLITDITFAGDGNGLLSQCNAALRLTDNASEQNISKSNYLESGFCLGVMSGVINLNALYQELLGKKALFCLPKGNISNGQAVRIVVKYLNDHPEKLHEREVILIFNAFKEAYPCQ